MWSTASIAGKNVLIHEPPTGPPSGILFLLDEASPPFADAAFRSFVESSPYLWLFAFPVQSWWCEVHYPPFHPEITPADFVRQHCMTWLKKRLESSRIALAGIGCGGQAALKWAIQQPTEYSTVAAFDAAIDLFEIYGMGHTLDAIYPTVEKLRQQSASLHLQSYPFPDAIWMAVSPDSPWHRGNDRLHEKLNVLGAPHTYELYPGLPAEPGWFDPEMLDSLKRFLDANLNKPFRRRLL